MITKSGGGGDALLCPHFIVRQASPTGPTALSPTQRQGSNRPDTESATGVVYLPALRLAVSSSSDFIDIVRSVSPAMSTAQAIADSVPCQLARLDTLATTLLPPEGSASATSTEPEKQKGDREEMNSPVQHQEAAQPQPDADAIKMFVGQIPRSWDENELRNLFEDFGKVHSINVLRDKATGNSRGCCFVTFYTRKAALDAQNEMHNIKTLPGMHHPIQMKPADSENRNERKLFIGMLSKECGEAEVRMMFSSFGTIEECTVLRDSQSQSKGCAFVTYSTRQCAINAIKAMNHSQTMKGCSNPLVVKFADTQKEKDQKKQQQMINSLWNMANIVNLSAAAPAAHQPPATAYMPQNSFGGFAQATAVPNIAQLATLVAANGGTGVSGVSQYSTTSPQPASVVSIAGHPAATAAVTASPAGGDVNTAANLQSIAALAQLANSPAAQTGGGLNQVVMQNLASALASAAAQTNGSSSGNSSLSGVSSLSPVSLNSLANGMANHHQDLAQTYHPATAVPAASFVNLAIQNPAGKQVEGPDGANLFIYHLPQEFGDMDLVQTFLPFGQVISAKVFIDKQTNLSKCFGFVSYATPISAQAAIQSMNGFQIGAKRLKVQLKRSKDQAGTPY
ncbi:CUGBP Elav-like family member 2 isoform X1 [Varroa jacobsoni]|uniref:CUGBP Elav-like family member 2 isoform X1 n=1 Tax=Varroa jacobsoni TaxID=62625 RepID=UPI000BF712E7|nr:CUGBP Elav-like family member 2 isoform X1 [Varroa jacobsoni]